MDGQTQDDSKNRASMLSVARQKYAAKLNELQHVVFVHDCLCCSFSAHEVSINCIFANK